MKGTHQQPEPVQSREEVASYRQLQESWQFIYFYVFKSMCSKTYMIFEIKFENKICRPQPRQKQWFGEKRISPRNTTWTFASIRHQIRALIATRLWLLLMFFVFLHSGLAVGFNRDWYAPMWPLVWIGALPWALRASMLYAICFLPSPTCLASRAVKVKKITKFRVDSSSQAN